MDTRNPSLAETHAPKILDLLHSYFIRVSQNNLIDYNFTFGQTPTGNMQRASLVREIYNIVRGIERTKTKINVSPLTDMINNIVNFSREADINPNGIPLGFCVGEQGEVAIPEHHFNHNGKTYVFASQLDNINMFHRLRLKLLPALGNLKDNDVLHTDVLNLLPHFFNEVGYSDIFNFMIEKISGRETTTTTKLDDWINQLKQIDESKEEEQEEASSSSSSSSSSSFRTSFCRKTVDEITERLRFQAEHLKSNPDDMVNDARGRRIQAQRELNKETKTLKQLQAHLVDLQSLFETVARVDIPGLQTTVNEQQDAVRAQNEKVALLNNKILELKKDIEQMNNTSRPSTPSKTKYRPFGLTTFNRDTWNNKDPHKWQEDPEPTFRQTFDNKVSEFYESYKKIVLVPLTEISRKPELGDIDFSKIQSRYRKRNPDPKKDKELFRDLVKAVKMVLALRKLKEYLNSKDLAVCILQQIFANWNLQVRIEVCLHTQSLVEIATKKYNEERESEASPDRNIKIMQLMNKIVESADVSCWTNLVDGSPFETWREHSVEYTEEEVHSDVEYTVDAEAGTPRCLLSHLQPGSLRAYHNMYWDPDQTQFQYSQFYDIIKRLSEKQLEFWVDKIMTGKPLRALYARSGCCPTGVQGGWSWSRFLKCRAITEKYRQIGKPLQGW